MLLYDAVIHYKAVTPVHCIWDLAAALNPEETQRRQLHAHEHSIKLGALHALGANKPCHL